MRRLTEKGRVMAFWVAFGLCLSAGFWLPVEYHLQASMLIAVGCLAHDRGRAGRIVLDLRTIPLWLVLVYLIVETIAEAS